MATQTQTLEVFVYAQHTTLAGKRVPERELERYYCEDRDPRECDDFVCYEGTSDELEELARSLVEANKGKANQHDRRTAATILEEIGWTQDEIDAFVWGGR